MKSFILLLLMVGIYPMSVNAQKVITVEDIPKHIGDSVKICTRIYGGRYLHRSKDQPTYLEVGADYPNQPLTILIRKKDRENFEDRPEMIYAYRNVCIIGSSN